MTGSLEASANSCLAVEVGLLPASLDDLSVLRRGRSPGWLVGPGHRSNVIGSLGQVLWPRAQRGDHFGTNAELRRLTGARLMIHALDAPALEGPVRWRDITHRPGLADLTVRDGDLIDLGDRRLEVIHLPGHTPGSIGLLLREEGVLIAGDSLQALGTGIQRLALYNDPDTYVASVQRVSQLGLKHLLMAHAYEPFTDNCLHGLEIRHFLEISRGFALGLDALILEILKRAQEPLSASGITDRICARYGTGSSTKTSTATVTAHLGRLAAMELVTLSSAERDTLYVLS